MISALDSEISFGENRDCLNNSDHKLSELI